MNIHENLPIATPTNPRSPLATMWAAMDSAVNGVAKRLTTGAVIGRRLIPGYHHAYTFVALR